MDRRLSYIDANPDILDILLNSRFALESDAKLAEAVLGPNPVVSGFACAPTSPASMTVNVGPGQVYQMAALESSAISALNADTRQVLKQGLSREITPLTLVAPTTVGTAVNVLIEVAYLDDKSTTQAVFNYYNAANPDVPLTGVGGNNLPQTSVIRGVAQLQTKYGVPATSGSQTTPTPDAGFVPLFVVTLTQGQTAISGNIAVAPNAPFPLATLPAIPAGVQAGQWLYGVDTGSAGALAASFSPTPASLPDGMQLHVKALNAAVGGDTFNPAGLGALPILRRGGVAPLANDWAAGDVLTLRKRGSAWQLSGIVPSDVKVVLTAAAIVGSNIWQKTTAGTYTFTVPAGVFLIRVQLWGGGGGGGGSTASGNVGSGGAGGGYTSATFAVTPGQVLTVIIGAGGAQVTNGGTTSIAGLSSAISATGGGGGVNGNNGAQSASPSGGQGYGGVDNRQGRFGGVGLVYGSFVAGGFGGASGYQGADAQFGFNVGIPGIAPGGGGGGANNGQVGGSGADGQVTINY